MSADRLIRISLAGVGFIFSALYFDWFLGGTIVTNYLEKPDSNFTEIIGLFLSSPLIGFVLSTIIHGNLLIIFGPGFIFGYHSLDIQERKEYLEALSILLKSDFIGKRIDDFKVKNSLIRKELKELSLLHQVGFRSFVKEELIEYCVRRATIVWTNINLVWAFFVGLLLALFHTDIPGFDEIFGVQICLKVITATIIVFYAVAAIWHIMRNRKELFRVELSAIMIQPMKTTKSNK